MNINYRQLASGMLVPALILLGYCQSESNVRSAPEEPLACESIANCLECDPEATVCQTCEEGFTWNGSQCVEAGASGTVCSGGPSRVISFTDANGVIHYHCLK